MHETAEKMVRDLLESDDSGHDWKHIQRVRKMARKLSRKLPADEEKTDLLALLHDVDDYKLVGMDQAAGQSNARRILQAMKVSGADAAPLLSEIARMGFSKSLVGVEPETLEGQICQDADFLDAVGVYGLMRACDYGKSRGQVLFDPALAPVSGLTFERYTTEETHVVQHFFDKLLQLDRYMLTDAGRQEAKRRIAFLEEFLEELFVEEDASVWLDFLHGVQKSGT